MKYVRENREIYCGRSSIRRETFMCFPFPLVRKSEGKKTPLLLTHTFSSGRSRFVSFGTLTLERAGGVHALRNAPARRRYAQALVVV